MAVIVFARSYKSLLFGLGIMEEQETYLNKHKHLKTSSESVEKSLAMFLLILRT